MMDKPLPLPWWAATSWWEQDPPYEWLGCSEMDFRAAVDVMKQHFDERWWDESFSESRPGNLVAARLIGGGRMVSGFIYEVGSYIGRLGRSPGFDSKLKELKTDQKTASTLVELRVADALVQRGLTVRFPSEGKTKTPDIVVDHSHGDVAVECKRLDRPEVQQWAQELLYHCFSVQRHLNVGVELFLEPDLTMLRMDAPAEWNSVIIDSLASSIREAMHTALGSTPVPGEVVVPGIARVRLIQDRPDQSRGQGTPISGAAELRRIVATTLEAGEQIPPKIAGVVVAQCDTMPGSGLARAAVDAMFEVETRGRHRVDRVAAIMILPAPVWGLDQTPLLLRARLQNRSPRVDAVIDAFTQAFKPIVA